MDKDKARDNKFGWMVQGTLANGRITKQMVKEFYIIPMAMYMMDNGSTIKQVGKVPIHILTAPPMLESGLKISKMEEGEKCGQMGKYMKDSTKMDVNMEKDCLRLLIKAITRASLS
jgi:hypothetical protein